MTDQRNICYCGEYGGGMHTRSARCPGGELRTPQGEPALTPTGQLPGTREPVVIAPQGNAGESPAPLLPSNEKTDFQRWNDMSDGQRLEDWYSKIREIERLRPMAESWQSYEAAQERKRDVAGLSKYARDWLVSLRRESGGYPAEVLRHINILEQDVLRAERIADHLGEERDRLHGQLLQHAEVCGESAYPLGERVTDETSDSEPQSCQEPDGCPTESAVLKRFWRLHRTCLLAEEAKAVERYGPPLTEKPSAQETTALPASHKPTCEGGTGGPCTQPDCEKCWDDEGNAVKASACACRCHSSSGPNEDACIYCGHSSVNGKGDV